MGMRGLVVWILRHPSFSSRRLLESHLDASVEPHSCARNAQEWAPGLTLTALLVHLRFLADLLLRGAG